MTMIHSNATNPCGRIIDHFRNHRHDADKLRRATLAYTNSRQYKRHSTVGRTISNTRYMPREELSQAVHHPFGVSKQPDRILRNKSINKSRLGDTMVNDNNRGRVSKQPIASSALPGHTEGRSSGDTDWSTVMQFSVDTSGRSEKRFGSEDKALRLESPAFGSATKYLSSQVKSNSMRQNELPVFNNLHNNHQPCRRTRLHDFYSSNPNATIDNTVRTPHHPANSLNNAHNNVLFENAEIHQEIEDKSMWIRLKFVWPGVTDRVLRFKTKQKVAFKYAMEALVARLGLLCADDLQFIRPGFSSQDDQNSLICIDETPDLMNLQSDDEIEVRARPRKTEMSQILGLIDRSV